MASAKLANWTSAGLLIAMATFAMVESKSSSLIPKSLFLWPACGFLFGLFTAANGFLALASVGGSQATLVLGIVVLACSMQALLVNIRRISRWPSGALWLTFLLIGIIPFLSDPTLADSDFEVFLSRLMGLLWACVGVTKVISEKSVSQEGGIPVWIQLLYVQALLLASLPY